MTSQKLIGHVTQLNSGYVTKYASNLSCGEYVWEDGHGSITNNCNGDWRDIVHTRNSFFCAGAYNRRGIWKATYNNNSWTFTDFSDFSNPNRYVDSCYFIGALYTGGLPGSTTTPREVLITSFAGEGIWYRELFDDSTGISTVWTQTNIKTGTYKLRCNLNHAGPAAILVSDGGRKVYKTTQYAYTTGWSEYSLGNDVFECYALIELNSGRVLACTDAGIKYSDNRGATWNTLVADKFITNITSHVDYKERLFATFRGEGNKIYYSDDGGLMWTEIVLDTTNLGLTSASQIFIPSGYGYTLDNVTLKIPLGNVPDKNWRLGTIQINVSLKTSINKYLDQNGVQEIVTQFKTYCDNLVGGA